MAKAERHRQSIPERSPGSSDDEMLVSAQIEGALRGDLIARRAYELYEECGREDEHDWGDWFRAEREMQHSNRRRRPSAPRWTSKRRAVPQAANKASLPTALRLCSRVAAPIYAERQIDDGARSRDRMSCAMLESVQISSVVTTLRPGSWLRGSPTW